MKKFDIVDSNVIAIANRLHDTASLACIKNSIILLKQLEESLKNNDAILVLDNLFLILKEYQKHCYSPSPQYFGTTFVKWVFQNYSKFTLYTIPKDIETNDNLLPQCFKGFDRNDRKYLYLSLLLKESSPTLHYGIDRGYMRYNHCFEIEGIALNEICKS